MDGKEISELTCEYGSLQSNRSSTDRPRLIRSARALEQNVLDTIRRNLSSIVRVVTAAVGGSRSSVHRTLQCEGKPLLSYHLQNGTFTNCDAN
ncbi:hypothetical protein TNCV_2776061 [Trichonephila clavipes]|nr:hypothetical protein TNCV_2776061 [Trichonephila clavipes]